MPCTCSVWTLNHAHTLLHIRSNAHILGVRFYCNKKIVFFNDIFRNIVSKYEVGSSVLTSISEESSAVAQLLLENANPLVGEMTEDNQLNLFVKRPLLVAYFDVDWDKPLKKGQ